MLLDKIMPEYEFGEVHSIQLSASPEAALAAFKEVTPGEMPLVRLLFTLRSLPAHLMGRQGLPTEKTTSLYEQMLGFGFVPLGDKPNRELVAGMIGQMFKLRGETPTIRDACEFVAFEEPGYAKAAMNFFVESADRDTLLTTETRVMTTDSASRRRFGRYWRVIYPGSAAIRRSWLRAAKRRAEQGAEGCVPGWCGSAITHEKAAERRYTP
jgi:hypothetical protein